MYGIFHVTRKSKEGFGLKSRHCILRLEPKNLSRPGDPSSHIEFQGNLKLSQLVVRSFGAIRIIVGSL